jgi:multicomponent Na+:H+ antiporter subunit C
MDYLISLIIGLLFASGIYLILRRSIVKLIIGLMLLSYGANLFLFATGKIKHSELPIIKKDQNQLSGDYADPVPQALVLTSIVISFGIQVFAIILINKTYLAVGSDDLDKMNTTDKIE